MLENSKSIERSNFDRNSDEKINNTPCEEVLSTRAKFCSSLKFRILLN